MSRVTRFFPGCLADHLSCYCAALTMKCDLAYYTVLNFSVFTPTLGYCIGTIIKHLLTKGNAPKLVWSKSESVWRTLSFLHHRIVQIYSACDKEANLSHSTSSLVETIYIIYDTAACTNTTQHNTPYLHEHFAWSS